LNHKAWRAMLKMEKGKAVLHNYATEIGIDTLAFALGLDDWRVDYDAISLSQEIQNIADKIIESFELKKQ